MNTIKEINEKYSIIGTEGDFDFKLTDEMRKGKLEEISAYLRTAHQFVFIALEERSQNEIISIISHVKRDGFIKMIKLTEKQFWDDLKAYAQKNDRGK